MSTENSEIVYHYTSVESAFYILGGSSPDDSSKTMRLSSSESLNDKSEMIEFKKSFESSLTKLFSANEVNDSVTKSAIEWIDELIDQYQDSASFYIASFSKDNDSLSQWRAYGDDATGVAIGINIDKIISLPFNQLTNNTFGSTFKVHCKYTNTDKKNALLKLITKAKQFLLQRPNIPDQIELNQFYSEIVQEICSFKNKAFSEEKEVRLVKVQIRESNRHRIGNEFLPKFKVTNYGIHAFIEVKIPDDAFESFVIGPKSSLDSNSKDLEYFLKRAGCINLTQEKITISDATYR